VLEPQSRTLVLDALRPPPAWRLDYAIGTTFSLDLVALLAAPLAFSFLDRADREGKLSADPVSLLQALRRSADRFAIFCQAGRIAVPRPDWLLLSYLERSVFEVSAPNGGVFHPKVWALRLLDEEECVHYRVVCATRNITFDRSWDTVLTLDGPLLDRKNAIAANHPLGEFVRALPGMALRKVPAAVAAKVKVMQDELRRVDFELPEDFSEYGFAAFGAGGRAEKIFKTERIDRLLVVSPFVTDGFLDSVRHVRENGVLISRREELEKLDPKRLKAFGAVYAFADDEPEEEGQDEATREVDTLIVGLHAKLYVLEAGWNVTLLTGSANATTAAFSENVEFLAALVGPRSKCGIDALLREGKGQSSLKSFLEEFVPGEPRKEDPVAVELERRLEEARKALTSAGWRGTASEVADGTWQVLLRAERKTALDEAIEFKVWPITCRSETFGARIDAAARVASVKIAGLPFETITSFFAFEGTLELQGRAMAVRFVLNVPLDGLPVDREKRLLVKLLENREKVLAYLLLMLAGTEASSEVIDADAGAGGGEWRWSGSREAVFEALVRSLHRSPEKLDDVAKLVEDLRSDEVTRKLLPDGFDAIWDPIWAVRKRKKSERAAS
jgi:hypothetical protein